MVALGGGSTEDTRMRTLRLGDIPPLRRSRAAPPPWCKLPAYAGPSLIPLTLVVLGKSYRDSLWL